MCHVTLRILIFVFGFIGFETPRCEVINSKNVLLLHRWRRQTCKEQQFLCASGECIPEAFVCDGVRNCEDRSDETSETCLNSVIPALASYLDPPLISYIDKCPSGQYMCQNGKCIEKDKLCDGQMDCSDGSDEITELCTSVSLTSTEKLPTKENLPSTVSQTTISPSSISPPIKSNCELPAAPENGKYQVQGCGQSDCGLTPGSVISSFAILQFDCADGFELSGNVLVWCDGSKWSSSFPKCQKVLCPPLSNPTRLIECEISNAIVNCRDYMEPGTQATIKCENYYNASPELFAYDIVCDKNGSWSSAVHSCIPECGISNTNITSFASNGWEVQYTEYPWQVALFQDIMGVITQVCGGSIVSPRIIISAAHCFWDESSRSTFNISNFKIAAGKHYRDWGRREHYFQEAEIQSIIVNERYRGREGLYAEDIAIVTLKKDLVMSEGVRPVCIDIDGKYSRYFIPGVIGIVLGWGFTEKQIPSDVLRAVSFPYVDYATCEKESLFSIRPLLGPRDKFCAGTKTGKTVCRGDSGGGFSVRFGNDTRYFIMGIVSAGAAPQGDVECDINQYAVFTKIYEQIQFIRKHMQL